MKYIQKRNEPQDFAAWKEQEYAYISSDEKTADQLWDYFPSSCPKLEHQEPGLVYYSKTELKGTILDEQGALCCYCNQLLNNDHNTVLEHLEDKGRNIKLTLSYENILASCNGNQKEPKPRELHCDAEKNKSSIPIKPISLVCESELYFQEDGEIKSDSPNGQDTILILNLNHSTLVKNRNRAIEGFIFDDGGLINGQVARLLLERIGNRNTSNQFVEFCSAIKSVLQRLVSEHTNE